MSVMQTVALVDSPVGATLSKLAPNKIFTVSNGIAKLVDVNTGSNIEIKEEGSNVMFIGTVSCTTGQIVSVEEGSDCDTFCILHKSAAADEYANILTILMCDIDGEVLTRLDIDITDDIGNVSVVGFFRGCGANALYNLESGGHYIYLNLIFETAPTIFGDVVEESAIFRYNISDVTNLSYDPLANLERVTNNIRSIPFNGFCIGDNILYALSDDPDMDPDMDPDKLRFYKFDLTLSMPLSIIGGVSTIPDEFEIPVDPVNPGLTQNKGEMVHLAYYENNIYITYGKETSADPARVDLFDTLSGDLENSVTTNYLLAPTGTDNMINSTGIVIDGSENIYISRGVNNDATGDDILRISLSVPEEVVCFNEGSQILTNSGYQNIETLKKGTLVRTFRHGLVPIDMVGYSVLDNPIGIKKIKNKMYKLEQKDYPELIQDLYLTGCHSLLVQNLTEVQRIKTMEDFGKLYVTDGHYRLMTYLNEKSSAVYKKGLYKVWHIALENENYYTNYGIYANGLLVESTSKRMVETKMNSVE
jgi:hypothetical protein